MSEPTLTSLAVQLARIEGMVAQTHAAVAQHLADDVKVHTDHEHRIRSNEKFRWRATGYAAGAAAIVSSGVTYGIQALKAFGKS